MNCNSVFYLNKKKNYQEANWILKDILSSILNYFNSLIATSLLSSHEHSNNNFCQTLWWTYSVTNYYLHLKSISRNRSTDKLSRFWWSIMASCFDSLQYLNRRNGALTMIDTATGIWRTYMIPLSSYSSQSSIFRHFSRLINAPVDSDSLTLSHKVYQGGRIHTRFRENQWKRNLLYHMRSIPWVFWTIMTWNNGDAVAFALFSHCFLCLWLSGPIFTRYDRCLKPRKLTSVWSKFMWNFPRPLGESVFMNCNKKSHFDNSTSVRWMLRGWRNWFLFASE